MTFTLQVLHASDLEGGIDAIERAPNFAAIIDSLEGVGGIDASITLSAGDNYIPGPFLSAAGDPSLRQPFNAVYNQLFGLSSDGYADLREGVGRVDLSIMNVIGFDASAFGNHEFDLGTPVVREILIPDFRGAGLANDRWVGSQFPYLSANLDFSADANLSALFTSDILPNTAFASGPDASLAGTSVPKIAPATIIEVEGERIGVVGATTPLLGSISSPGATTVRDPGAGTNDMAALAQILQPVINQLRDQGVDKIVLTSHLQQITLEQQLAPLLTGVDIFIAGGSDTLLANTDDPLRPGDTAAGSYPIVTRGKDGAPAVIVSTDGEYSYVGRLVVQFNDDGVLVDAAGQPIDAVADLDATRIGPVASTDEAVAALWGDEEAAFADGTKGDLVATLVDAVSTVVTSQDGNVFGQTDVFLEGRRAAVRTEETNFGNLSADANLWLGQQTDADAAVSIKNGGGIRNPIGTVVEEPEGSGNYVLVPPQGNEAAGKEPGQISQLDIADSLRFNNGLTLLTVTAEQLLEVLEHGVAATAPGATPGQFPQIGGVHFSFDPEKPAGERIQSAAIVDDTGAVIDALAIEGALLGDPARPIRLVTLNFLADGGDNYPFPRFVAEDPAFANRVDLVKTGARSGEATFANDGTEQDALAEYLATRFPADNDAATPAFAAADTTVAEDGRIQNLSARDDGVLDAILDELDFGGTSGRDAFTGTAADEVIAGVGGNDALFGGDGNDTILGGTGNDRLRGDGGDDSIVGGDGNDNAEGGDGNDSITLTPGDDTAIGGDGDDTLITGDGNDRLLGGDGNDDLAPGTGRNTVDGGDGNDLVTFEDAGDAGLAVDVDLAAGNAGLFTPSMLAGRNGYEAHALFTVGESIGDYTPPGLLDGIGAYGIKGKTIRVLVNHELDHDEGYAYTVNGDVALTGARVSYFDINTKTFAVVRAGLAYDTVYGYDGELITDAAQLGVPDLDENGEVVFGADVNQGFDRFCSAALFEPNAFGRGRGFADRIFFAPQEANDGVLVALDVDAGEAHLAPGLGYGNWENVATLDTGRSDRVAMLLGDDDAPAPLYLYVGEKQAGGDFLARNGLEKGTLSVFVADTGETSPEEFSGTGRTVSGRFVPVTHFDPTKAGEDGWDAFGYALEDTLLEQAEAAGALLFARVEDLSTDPGDATRAVFATTGRSSVFNGADSWGTVEVLDVNLRLVNRPTATLSILYDGNADTENRALRSADNLDWADDGFIYVQEDAAVDAFGEEPNTNEASIVRLDPDALGGDPLPVAEIDRSSVLPTGTSDGEPEEIGSWESSGILDISSLLKLPGGSVFLADVEAHSIEDGVIASEDLVQGGQLNVLYGPGVAPRGTPADTTTVAGVETVTGTRYSDVFSGGAGDVTVEGLEGADLFVIGAGEGVLTVADFEQGVDHLGLAGDLSFDDVTLTAGGGGTTIAADGRSLALVEGVTLTEDDFVLL